MHLFRSSTPYPPAPGLFHCLYSSLTCLSSFPNAPQSRWYFSSPSSSAADNPSRPRKYALPNNYRNSGGRMNYDASSRSSSSKSIQRPPLASPSPDDAPRTIKRPIGRLDISDETTYVSRYSAISNNGRRYAKNSGDYGSDFFYVKGQNISRDWHPGDRNYGRSNTRQKSLERRRQAESIPQRMSFPFSPSCPSSIFFPLVFGNSICAGHPLSKSVFGLY